MCLPGGWGRRAQIIVNEKNLKKIKDNRRRLNGSVSRLRFVKSFHEYDSSDPCRTQLQF